MMCQVRVGESLRRRAVPQAALFRVATDALFLSSAFSEENFQIKQRRCERTKKEIAGMHHFFGESPDSRYLHANVVESGVDGLANATDTARGNAIGHLTTPGVVRYSFSVCCERYAAREK